jgi:transcriptional regulator with XRE-family HTH domain
VPDGVTLHLREQRLRTHGVTLATIAEALTYSKGYISRLERRERELKIITLAQWATALDCHPFDLVTFEGFPPPRRCVCIGHEEES